MLRGQVHFLGTWNYMVSGEYNGFDRDIGDPLWNMTDIWLSTRLGALGTLKLGKQKEPFVYEMVGDAANLPHDERFLSPFFTSRNVGVSMTNTYLGERATWTVGWFNDWWTNGQAFANSGNLRPAVFGLFRRSGTHVAVATATTRRRRCARQAPVDVATLRRHRQFPATTLEPRFQALWAEGLHDLAVRPSWTPWRPEPSFYGWYATAAGSSGARGPTTGRPGTQRCLSPAPLGPLARYAANERRHHRGGR
jgi:hypothetical protein